MDTNKIPLPTAALSFHWLSDQKGINLNSHLFATRTKHNNTWKLFEIIISEKYVYCCPTVCFLQEHAL
jgi:hypothetical protein